MRKLLPASIRSKLILLGVLAFLPVILLTIFNSWHQRKSDVADAKERMAKILKFAVLHEEENVRETHRILATLAEIPIVRKGGNPASEYLARFLKNSPEFANVGLIRPNGQVIASALPFNKSLNLSDRSYFQDAIKTRSFSVGQYQVGRISGKPVLNFGYPILDRQGKVSAVIFTALDLSLITKFEAEIDVQTPENSPYVKLDNNGAVLTSYPAAQVFGRGHPLEKSLFERISREKRGTFVATGVDGVERMYVFSPFRGPLSKEGGYALLGIPTKALFAETNRLLLKNLAVLSVVCLLFLAIMWFGGNILIVRTAGALVDATKRLAGDDLTARSGLESTQGELGQLARAFDEMAEELERKKDESQRRQDALRVSVAKAESEKAKTEAIIAGIGDGISIQDRDYRIIYQNQVHKDLIGDHVGEFCYTAYEGRNQSCEHCPLAVSFRDGRIHTVERTAMVDGKTINVEVTASPLKDSSGDIVAGIEVVRDITERVRSSEVLQESEAKYRSLFEHMQEGCAYCKMIFENGDPVDFIYLSVNAAFETLTGLKDVVGKRVSEVIPGIRASDPALFETYGRVARTGEPEKIEIFVEALQQWFLISVYSPEQGYFVAVFDVITDQKRAEETARRETALRNILLDNLPCIALVLKKRTREIVACNEIAKNYGAAVGKICYDVLAVPGTPCPFCLAPEVWETSETKQIEVEYMGKFWHGIWVPFSDDLYVHYIFEITDRRRSEVEKEKLQAQLLQATKMEAVGRLAGGVAHDFNNLLTVIIGNVSMAQAKLSTDDPVKGVLMEVNKAAERAAALTQQLLAFSRKQIIEPKILNLNDLIADLNAMLVRLIREDIKIQILPGKDLGVAKVDVGQFQQVLVNLVVNARDSMPSGGQIVIETSNEELDDGYCSMHPYVKPGRFVMIAVSDTGHGMSEEVKEHIFEPFFTTKAKGSGTGLGLSTTYGVVKQAGGSIEVYSEVGMGTTFKIYLPRAEGEASQLVRDDQPQKLLGGTETVLLVEDEEIVRDLCVSILDELGYRVLQASNGKEAIALSKGHGGQIDLLMTDVVMPGMNGRELATQLILDHPEARVLFTSGYTENVIVHHGVLDDSVSFLGKPYSPSALAKKIREVLDRVE
jgi:PAS domain S-box-containing protein